MAINGRINVDVLFHDTDGTTSLKVVSLEDSTEYTSGKVAVVTGTVGTSEVTVYVSGVTDYKDAAGDAVTISNIQRLAYKASGQRVRFYDGFAERYASGDVVNVTQVEGVSMSVQTTAGTASYTLVLYGT
jgi:hypothetical protein